MPPYPPGMNATLPVRSKRSGCADVRTAMLQLDAGLLRRGDELAERALRYLLRVVIGSALDHDADLDREKPAVAGSVQLLQIPRVREIAFARHEKFVVWTPSPLVFEIRMDGERDEPRHVLVHVSAHHLEMTVVEIEAEVRRVDRLHEPDNFLGQIHRLADVRLQRQRATGLRRMLGQLGKTLRQQDA